MNNQVVMLDPTKHADLKAKKADFSFAADQHLIPLAIHEVGFAAIDAPVIFVKNAETGEFQIVSMLGLKPGENLMVKDGKWQGQYYPYVVRDYPFTPILHPEHQDKLWIGVREDASVLGTDEGVALFAEGKETEFMTARKEEVLKHFEAAQLTKELLKVLVEKELLVAQTLTVNVGEEQRNINGIYLIDEQKLNGLSDEAFLELRKRGLLAPIYSHLTSLSQASRLAKLELLKNKGE
ncbi:SapC family protein [Shewanella sp. 3B26]|uniref:SapC family protein n=1 Tax=Shewanella zhuhaiensis TaxID=2919576 RepID=A0AAJ1F9N3_9GAMM|nr:SapC family protein [Shewanella zhuhaiensis]MCH4293330.1 SapC family protein [Shewanella zhuhaiensis]